MLEAVKKEGDKAVEKTQKRIAKELKSKKFVSLDDYIIERVKKKSAIFWLQNFLFGKNLHLEIPPAHITADLSLSLLIWPKNLNKTRKTAEESAGIINKSKTIL